MSPEGVGRLSCRENNFIWHIPSFKILEQKTNCRIWSPLFSFSQIPNYDMRATHEIPTEFIGLIAVSPYDSYSHVKYFEFGVVNDRNLEISRSEGKWFEKKKYFRVSNLVSRNVFRANYTHPIQEHQFRIFCEVIKERKRDAVNASTIVTKVSGQTSKYSEDLLESFSGCTFSSTPANIFSPTQINERKRDSVNASTIDTKICELRDAAVQTTENEGSEYDSCKQCNYKTHRDLEKLSQNFKDLYIQGQDTDLVLMVKNQEFKAHKAILRSRSPVFNAMFSHKLSENNSGIVPIEDCEPAAFEEFLLFVYAGSIQHLSSDNVCELYYVADKYQIPELKEECVSFLKKSLSIEMICDVICLSTKHNETELLDHAITFFTRNMEEILVTVKWQTFLRENPTEANELTIKALKLGFKKIKV